MAYYQKIKNRKAFGKLESPVAVLFTTYGAFRIPSRQPVVRMTGTVKLFQGTESGNQ